MISYILLIFLIVQFPSLHECSNIRSGDTPPSNPNLFQPGLLSWFDCVDQRGIGYVGNCLSTSLLPFKFSKDSSPTNAAGNCARGTYPNEVWNQIKQEFKQRIQQGYLYHYFIVNNVCSPATVGSCCENYSFWFGPDVTKVKAPCVSVADVGASVSFTTRAKVVGGSAYITDTWSKAGYGVTKFRDRDLISPNTVSIINYHVLDLKKPDYVSMTFSGYNGRFAWYTNDPGLLYKNRPAFTGCDWTQLQL